MLEPIFIDKLTKKDFTEAHNIITREIEYIESIPEWNKQDRALEINNLIYLISVSKNYFEDTKPDFLTIAECYLNLLKSQCGNFYYSLDRAM